MREEAARLIESLREQRRLYERMLALVHQQEATDPSQTEPLLQMVSEHRALSAQAEAVQREAALRKKAVDSDPLGLAPQERDLIQEEIDRVQQTLQELIRIQQSGIERLGQERDQVAARIQKISQGRRALSAYGNPRGRTPNP